MPKPKLTDDEREERREARNARKRERYAEEKAAHFIESATHIPEDDRRLLSSIMSLQKNLNGMARAKADWIISSWKDGQPKVGWQNDAHEVIRGAR